MTKEIKIELKVTDTCNQRCPHCMNGDGPEKKGKLETELFLERLREFENEANKDFLIKAIRMTGGEPLLNMDAIKEISESASSYGISTGINTNGVRLQDRNIVRKLKEYGISKVKISYDANTDELMSKIRGVPISVQRILTGIGNVIDEGMDAVLRFTLSRDNLEHLIPAYKQAVEIGVSNFQIKPLIASGRALQVLPGSNYLSRNEIVNVLSGLKEFEDNKTPAQMLCWSPVYASGLQSKTCASLDKVYVDTDLKVSLCNFMSQDSVLGDLNYETFEEVFRRQNVPTSTLPCGGKMPTSCPQTEIILRK